MVIKRYEESKKDWKKENRWRSIKTGKCRVEGKVSKGQLMVDGALRIMFYSGLRFLLLPLIPLHSNVGAVNDPNICIPTQRGDDSTEETKQKKELIRNEERETNTGEKTNSTVNEQMRLSSLPDCFAGVYVKLNNVLATSLWLCAFTVLCSGNILTESQPEKY